MSKKITKSFNEVTEEFRETRDHFQGINKKPLIPNPHILTILDFQAVSMFRYSVHDNKMDWSVAEISQALSGEVGELQNKLKKKYTQEEKVKNSEIEEEFADVLKYLFILANKCGINLQHEYTKKWNNSLKKHGKKK